MSIASDGYVLVHRCVDSKTLDALREEADHLFKLKDEKDALSEDDYFENVSRSRASLKIKRTKYLRQSQMLFASAVCAYLKCSIEYKIRAIPYSHTWCTSYIFTPFKFNGVIGPI